MGKMIDSSLQDDPNCRDTAMAALHRRNQQSILSTLMRRLGRRDNRLLEAVPEEVSSSTTGGKSASGGGETSTEKPEKGKSSPTSGGGKNKNSQDVEGEGTATKYVCGCAGGGRCFSSKRACILWTVGLVLLVLALTSVTVCVIVFVIWPKQRNLRGSCGQNG